MILESRFATKEEIFGDEFSVINKRLFEINKRNQLVDHSEINEERFPWSKGLFESPAVYTARMWEYPFALLSAELEEGMKCADVGCGTSPFTIYLAEVAGRSCVTGFDPDETNRNTSDSAFGASRTLLNDLGINYSRCDMSALDAPDEAFDRVFCISVLEHIEEPAEWQKGIREMVRILKPGGRLIITVDLAIKLPLVNPLDLIRYSGLSICGSFNYLWPKERFVKLDNNSFDVFGLILEKNIQRIFLDYEKTKNITQVNANNNFIPFTTDSKQMQISKDLRRNGGMWRVLAKLISGKYRV